MLNAIAEILQDIAYPPLPDGLCVVELFGHNRTRGTVRRRWYGLRPMIEITSHEPDGGTTQLVNAGSIYRLSAATSQDADDLERDWRSARERAERDRLAKVSADERERLMAEADVDPSKAVHLVRDAQDEATVCGKPWRYRTERDNSRTTEDLAHVTCRECRTIHDADVPY
jgi:hypothetical protein